MPYVITTTTATQHWDDRGPLMCPVCGRRVGWDGHAYAICGIVAHLDVDTLDEAHAITRAAVRDAYNVAYGDDGDPEDNWMSYVTSDDPQSPFVPESGGTVGPLPDGTIIKVTPK